MKNFNKFWLKQLNLLFQTWPDSGKDQNNYQLKKQEKIINKDREKVRQNKKKLKGNTDKMLEAKKLNTISKTILTGKEKSDRVRNSRGVPSPSSSTDVPPPSSSIGVPSPSSSTGVQSVPPSKSVLNGVSWITSQNNNPEKRMSPACKTRKTLPLLVIQTNTNFQLFHSVLILAMAKKLLIPPFPLVLRMLALMEAQNCPLMTLREASLLFKRKKKKSLKKKKKKKKKKTEKKEKKVKKSSKSEVN